MRTRKNGFLTFVFACVPGAGQMYYGYMHRGLSLLALFCLSLGLSSIVGAFAVLLPVVWMYSFFDTYDLIHRAEAGNPKEDAFLLCGNENAPQLFANHSRLLGWLFVGMGIWALYDNLLSPMLVDALSMFLDWNYVWNIFHNMVPTAVVALLLIGGGLWLLKKPARPSDQPTALAQETHYPKLEE